jgi:hypothetical protein
MKIIVNGIAIEIEDSGGTGVPVLLVMGLGMQLVALSMQATACCAWTTATLA